MAQAGAHALFQGGLSAAQGGNFWQSAAVGGISSLAASAIGTAGNRALNGAVTTEQANKIITDIAITQSMTGAFIGGTVSEISGGNFEEGFATGLTVAALNHTLHSGAKLFTDPKKNTGYYKAQFKRVSQIGQGGNTYRISKETIISLNTMGKYLMIGSTIWGSVDLNLATGTYLTTNGVRKPIWTDAGKVRSARAGMYATQYRLVRTVSYGFGAFGTALDLVGVYNYYANPNDSSAYIVSPGRFALNATFTGIGLWGGPVGWFASSLYFGGTYLYDKGYLKPGKSPIGDPGTIICFIAGTKITMGDGSLKNIENVKNGDIIKSFNEEKSLVENKEVLLKEESFSNIFVEIIFENGTKNINTPSHPYYIKNKGWSSFDNDLTFKKYHFKVDKIEIGDTVYKLNIKTNKLEEIKIKEIKILEKKMKTYNISNVKDNHSFFANGILVHNRS